MLYIKAYNLRILFIFYKSESNVERGRIDICTKNVITT